MGQSLVTGFYADDVMLMVENKRILQRTGDKFDRICKRRKFKVNVGKSKVKILEKAGEQIHACKVVHVRVWNLIKRRRKEVTV